MIGIEAALRPQVVRGPRGRCTLRHRIRSRSTMEQRRAFSSEPASGRPCSSSSATVREPHHRLRGNCARPTGRPLGSSSTRPETSFPEKICAVACFGSHHRWSGLTAHHSARTFPRASVSGSSATRARLGPRKAGNRPRFLLSPGGSHAHGHRRQDLVRGAPVLSTGMSRRVSAPTLPRQSFVTL